MAVLSVMGYTLQAAPKGKDYVTSGDKYPVLNKRGPHVSPGMKFKWVKYNFCKKKRIY